MNMNIGPVDEYGNPLGTAFSRENGRIYGYSKKDGRYIVTKLGRPDNNNSLLERRPDIAKEFNTELNGISPSEVCYCCRVYAWFTCPKCGKNYYTLISNRTNNNRSCVSCDQILCRRKSPAEVFIGLSLAAHDIPVSFKERITADLDIDIYDKQKGVYISVIGDFHNAKKSSLEHDDLRRTMCNTNNKKLFEIYVTNRTDEHNDVKVRNGQVPAIQVFCDTNFSRNLRNNRNKKLNLQNNKYRGLAPCASLIKGVQNYFDRYYPGKKFDVHLLKGIQEMTCDLSKAGNESCEWKYLNEDALKNATNYITRNRTILPYKTKK